MATKQKPPQPASGTSAPLPTPVTQLLANYTPATVDADTWTLMRGTVTSTVELLGTATTDAARRQLQVLVPYVQWLHETFGDLADAQLLTPRRVTQFCALAAADQLPNRAFSTGSVNQFASRLTSIGRRLNPGAEWPRAAVGTQKRNLKAPYSDVEVSAFTAALTEPGTHQKPSVQLAFHILIGAGLTPAEYRELHVADICPDEHGALSATVHSGRARSIPIAAPHAKHLSKCLPQSGDTHLLTARGTNGLSALFNSRPIGPDQVVLSAGRLRTTWMIHRLRAGATPATVARYAGLSSYGFVAELAPYLPAQSEETIRHTLTAAPPP